MAMATTFSAALVGVEAQLVQVEANVGQGLPGTYIVGLADASIAEARDRMKTAASNLGLQWPKTKVVVGLSPASLRKHGSHFDLAMMMAILTAGQPRQRGDVLIMGEVSLKGEVLGVPGVLPALLMAREHGITQAVVPHANLSEALQVEGVEVYLAQQADHVWQWLQGIPLLKTAQESGAGERSDAHPAAANESDMADMADMADVVGQPEAKWAAEVAAAGGHNMFIVGPPGSGKSMIAMRMPSIMTELDNAQRLEVQAIRSVLGQPPVAGVPIVAPHHGVSVAGLLGGGSGRPLPGAVSLAHHGVLFLDEVSEMAASVLDSLRVPLEEGQVRMVRNHTELRFPARFQLILAANPCRCGAEEPQDCRCSAVHRARYLRNVSGPLRDRLDLFVRTYSKGQQVRELTPVSSAQIASRVAAARGRMLRRFGVPNAHMDPHVLRRQFPADEAGMALLQSYLEEGIVTQRGVDRALKVAWTIADLESAKRPGLDEVARALELREHA
ncbi:YifB family Mg chelatase-like AAA ATPase [Corynebacterium sp. 153RC1]|uniref:YifB family Mg chelatase-like AAA ATPase n=1 Tax=unclassified Corynebacterium TaxID=2624378 RepID=UPI00211C0869|nr:MULTISPECIES: YifB family Mg chelatase-like AAA ATPase [unclassified Corynebacterium]MCQ9351636.1 YifB family Mg chelatase-like AAA ATPase [Corynebacterium sp. 209RC1]MCQ9354005.1 YifB family Mg chelatase-like AAA ATPase [Corynebacterium sp. 1222RC1]MCQ9355919.1 YifB family Mg chelatase-like AAA ATPase [Corynebacterium sp. 122RC1]MCQ9358163.1 YifB family Mg chelatase-like AAA ATPase [Corynebacterium sp. 142RC1]MCQ9360233.1 YifB family Mg chelatase-like AAA ATPase [Corynebacterium sp. 153RC1